MTPGSWLWRYLPRALAALTVLLAASIAWAIIRSPALEWSIVLDYLLDGRVLRGVRVTLLLTAAAMVLGALIGTVLALQLMSSSRVPRHIAGIYVWFFRGVPLLVQVIFWFNLATIFPQLKLTVPFTGIEVLAGSTNDIVTPLIAALLAFSLHEGAFMAEIIRAGFESVARGEVEAAQSLGFNRWQTFSRVRLPQAMGVIIPPTGNQVITCLKTTALVSMVSVEDLLYSVQIIYSRTFQVIPLLLVATIWYLTIVSALTLLQRRIERHFGKWRRPIARPARRWSPAPVPRLSEEANR